MQRILLLPLLLCMLLCLAACDAVQTQALKAWMASNENLRIEDGAVPYQARTERVSIRAVVEDLDFPWDMVFLDKRNILVTQKPGKLTRINLDTSERVDIGGVPEVAYGGQGGLMGLVLHPGFADNQLLYLSYAVEVESGRRTTRLLRARLVENELQKQQVLFTATPALGSSIHFGGAMVFDGNGYLYLSVGERGSRHNAQDLDSHLGKVHRLRDDGSVPVDNPFVGRTDARPEIFSWGHRNPQGLAIHPQTGELWGAEHGPRGGDEVNLIRAGKNYGWPVISHGEEYGGGKIGEGTAKAGLEQPVHYYLPSIGTAGIDFYHGDDIPGWQHNLFIGGLVYTETHLSRLAIDDNQVTDEEALFEHLKMRIRNVVSGPDSKLYVVTENGIIFVVASMSQGNESDD